MHSCTDTQAVCRGCGQLLGGSPYWKGGTAYVKRADGSYKHRAKANHFGGWVCSESCDRRAYLEQESSMPGHGWKYSIDPNTSREISRKWDNE